MEEMNQEQFEQMLGSESIDRMQYIDLFEQSRKHVTMDAVVGLMLLRTAHDLNDLFDKMGHEQGLDILQKLLRAITAMHMSTSKDFASNVVTAHFKYLNQNEITVGDMLRPSDVELMKSEFQRLLGWDAMGLFDMLMSDSEEEEE
jgi:hypothetical protein